jgi:hypothetical protein
MGPKPGGFINQWNRRFKMINRKLLLVALYAAALLFQGCASGSWHMTTSSPEESFNQSQLSNP